MQQQMRHRLIIYTPLSANKLSLNELESADLYQACRSPTRRARQHAWYAMWY